MVVHFPDHINTYGSFVGFAVGFVVRLLGGEPYISVPHIIEYPYFDHENNEQNFPFRTVSMLVSWITIVLSSAIFKALFKKGIIPKSWDVCECFYPSMTEYIRPEERKMRRSESDQDSYSTRTDKTPPSNCESSINLINCPAQVKLLKPDMIKVKEDYVKV